MKIGQVVFNIHVDKATEDIKVNVTHNSDGIGNEEKNEIKDIYFDIFKWTMLQTQGGTDTIKPEECFGFFKLKSENYCVLSINKVLQESSGLELYLSHVLILNEGFFSIYPVQACGTNTYKQVLPDSTNSGDIIKLPVLGYLRENPKINYNTVSEFIKSTKGFGLRHMIDTLIACEGRGILLQDIPENTLLWVAAIQMAFPLKRAHNVSFIIKTIQRGDIKHSLCKLSIEGNNIFTSDTEGFKYFDFISRNLSKPRIEHRFTRLVDMGYLISKETLDAFHKFLNRFQYDRLDEEIEHCYRLFNMTNFGIGKMGYEDVKSAVEFALKYSNQSLLEDIFERFDPMLDKIALEIETEKARLICGMLFKIANKSKKKLFINRSYDFFLNSFDNIIFKNNDFNKEDIFQLYKDIREVNRDRAEEFSSFMISPVRFKRISTLLQEGEFPKQALVYTQVTLHELCNGNYTWNRTAHIDYFKEFIDLSLEMISGSEDYAPLLETAVKKYDILVSFAIAMYNRVKLTKIMEQFMRSFNQVLMTMENKDSVEVRMMIYDLNPGSKFLLQEFEINIKYVENKEEYFWSYFIPGKGEFPEYFRKSFSEILKLYLKSLPEEIIDEECTRLIEYAIDDELFIEEYTITFIIKCFENQLPMEMPNENNEKLIKDIHEYKSARGIRTNPDITGLVAYGIGLSDGTWLRGRNIKEVIDNLPPVESLEEDRYISYINWVLPELMKFADLPEDYALIMDALCPAGMEEKFLNLYSMHLANVSQYYSTAYGFLNCYLYYIQTKLIYTGQAEIVKGMNDLITKHLMNQPYSIIKKLNTDLRRDFTDKRLPIPQSWVDIFNEVSSNKNQPIFEKVTSLFKRKEK